MVPLNSEASEATGIALPPGFSATVFYDGPGAVRHLAVRANGDVFAADRGANRRIDDDGGLIAFRDADGDGVAETVERRPAPVNTAVAVRDGHLYFGSSTAIYRIALDDGLMPQGDFEAVVDSFPEQDQHAAKTIAFDNAGGLYVNIGAPSNACQQQTRTPASPGLDPCPQLDRQSGVWRFDADRTSQTADEGERYVTGSRNAISMAWNTVSNALFLLTHGRDQLDTLWPEYFSAEENANIIAEEFHKVERGANLGWPYTFYDGTTSRRLMAPEYGGDGALEPSAGVYQEPIYAFPAHWAPMSILFYEGEQFPEAYRGGAFISFHGSWNRAPLEQKGYNVVFAPFEDGEMSGAPFEFAVGFPGRDVVESPGQAVYRPMGLAVGPDGALYIGDDVKGRIWKVVYDGDAE